MQKLCWGNLAMRTIEDSSEPHLQNRLGKLIPPSRGKSPFSLDDYLSWMSCFHPKDHTALWKVRQKILSLLVRMKVLQSPLSWLYKILANGCLFELDRRDPFFHSNSCKIDFSVSSRLMFSLYSFSVSLSP
jgi:hypothetical protein